MTLHFAHKMKGPLHYLSSSYREHLERLLKPYQFIRLQDGFNPSITPIPFYVDHYLVSVRVLGYPAAFFGEKIVPGNYSNRYTKIDEKIGVNFFWNNWLENLIDNTILFVLAIQDKKFVFDTSVQPLVINRKVIVRSCLMFYNDIRLCTLNNSIFMYDGLISEVYSVTIKNVNGKGIILYNNVDQYYQDYMTSSVLAKKNDVTKLYMAKIQAEFKTYDKNWALVGTVGFHAEKGLVYTEADTQKICFLFLCWFEGKYLTTVLISLDKSIAMKHELILMEQDVVCGLGTDYLPMFSFGSPCLMLEGDKYIGVGHTKIMKTKEYSSPKLMKFIELINKMSADYPNHINHASYIYCTYFYMFDLKAKVFTMSDSFLYVDRTREYSFSINFPMSIINDPFNNKGYLVTMGYGDYYSCYIQLTREELMSTLVHNIQSFNKESYAYILKA